MNTLPKACSIFFALFVGCSATVDRPHENEMMKAQNGSKVELSQDSDFQSELKVVQAQVNERGIIFSLLKKDNGTLSGIRMFVKGIPTVGKEYAISNSDPNSSAEAEATAYSDLSSENKPVTGKIVFTEVPAKAENLQGISAKFDLLVDAKHKVSGTARGLTYKCEQDPNCQSAPVKK